jgi:hypothetical protein
VIGATCDDKGVADNPSDTSTGPSGDTGPSGGEPTSAATTEPTTKANTEPTSDGAPQAEQVASGSSPRLRSGMRDMLLSMVVLAIGVLVLAAITRSCSFSPGGPSTNSSALPTVDVPAELQAAAGQVGFPLHGLQLPDGWRANSASVDLLGPNGQTKAVRIGWIAPDGRYLQVSQSSASPLDLVRSAAALGNAATIAPTGTQAVNGTKWTVYPGIRDEESWVADLGTERLFVTGNGTTADFRTLADAVRGGRTISPSGP